MGTQVEAKCPCGYCSTASIGSGRRNHGKVFYYPHLCHDCHIVETVDILSGALKCSKCGGVNLSSYGQPIKELPYGRWNIFKAWLAGDVRRHKQEKQAVQGRIFDSSYCYRTRTTYVITTEPSVCPACQESKLVFSLTALFD